MAVRGLYVFKHAGKLGSAAAHALQDRVAPKRRNAAAPPCGFGDFVIDVDTAALPRGVQLIEHNCSSFDAKPVVLGSG